MIASLPMYATPQTEGADARFWALVRDGLRKRGIHAPESLTSAPADLVSHWRDPRLVFSQTCGLPYRALLHDGVTLIGTPDYGVKGCPAGHYRSKVIVRADDPRTNLAAFSTARFAYNDHMSQSGWAALALEAPEVLQGPLIRTGSHRASVAAVRAGVADFAAVDAVTLRFLTATNDATGLRILYATHPTPGLPFIAAKSINGTAAFDAVADAIAKLPPDDRASLYLRDLIAVPKTAYDQPLPPAPADIRG